MCVDYYFLGLSEINNLWVTGKYGDFLNKYELGRINFNQA